MKHLFNFVFSFILFSNALFASSVGEKQVFNVGRMIASSLAEIEAQDFREHIKTEFKKIETNGPIKYLKEYSDEEFRSFLEENPSLFQVPVSQKFQMKEVRPDYWEAKVDGVVIQASLVDLYQQRLTVNGERLVLQGLSLKQTYEKARIFLEKSVNSKTTSVLRVFKKMFIDDVEAVIIAPLVVIAGITVVAGAAALWVSIDKDKIRHRDVQRQLNDLKNSFVKKYTLCMSTAGDNDQKALSSLLKSLSSIEVKNLNSKSVESLENLVLQNLLSNPEFKTSLETNESNKVCYDQIANHFIAKDLKKDVTRIELSKGYLHDSRYVNFIRSIEESCMTLVQLKKCLEERHSSAFNEFTRQMKKSPDKKSKISEPKAAPR
jgi:hypothetical protein